jgi:glucose uptake protein GlcU
MPTHLRFMLSVVVALVGAVAFYFERRGGDETMGWIMLGMAVLMIGAVWLFPEARRKDQGD